MTRVADRRGVKRKRMYQERDTEVYNTFTVRNLQFMELVLYLLAMQRISYCLQTTQDVNGDVEIKDHDLDGLFVKVHNRGDKVYTRAVIHFAVLYSLPVS